MQTHNQGDQVMATVQVWDLGSEDVGASLQTFMNVPADWAVRYA